MGRAKEFRSQPTSPLTPSDTGVFTYWANNNGILHFTNSAGTVTTANTIFTNASVSGQNAGAAGAITGAGALGAVAYWISGNVNGVKVVIPAYTASF